MRIWQWSFLEVVTLLTTFTQVHSTDKSRDSIPTIDSNLTQTHQFKKENSESNQLANYALSINNNSHPSTYNNESVPKKAGDLNEQTEVESRFDDFNIENKQDLESVLELREIEEAAEYGLRKMNELVNVKEPELYNKGLWLKSDSAAGRVSFFSAPVPQAQRLSRFGYAALQASTKLLQHWLGGAEVRSGPLLRLPTELKGSLRGTKLQRQCRVLTAPTPCRPAALRYRTADGSCNNLQRPRFGAALTPQQRFLAPRYDDGVQAVRANLPSPRLISTRIHRPRHIESPSTTLMLMQWGQLLDHDITSTPSARAFNGTTPRCCGVPAHLLHPECLPITVPNDDPVLNRFNIRCMEFVRSAPVPREDCDFGHRQQMNQVTSYIDASTIYGSSTSQADSIRLFRGGLLRFGTPIPPNGGEPCRMGAVSAQCLRPGDARASEQPALTAVHIIWVRLHNQIASGLNGFNAHWSDEKLYQETRRLIAGIIQHITYREFLPIILGHEVVRLFDLELLHKGYYLGYDQRVNPAPANSFSAAAYRFGHSLVQDSFVRSDKFHRPIFNNVSLHDEQTNTDNIWSPGSVDRLILGLMNQPSQKRDEFISAELTNHLFQAPGANGFGIDLAAINIQRGRDHGLPTYTAWRQPCGLSPVQNWTDLHRVMSSETAERFRSIFINVDDIDLYSAGLAERPVRGGIVGPTFACIIAQQFSNLRKGDRFWYENGNFESSFTSAQLQQIRKLTFAQIICQTMPEIETVQKFVFLSPDNLQNRRESCSNFDFDLTPWTENDDQANALRKSLESDNNTLKEKNSKDIFSFSLSSFELQTKQKPTTEDVLKQTVFRRDKRQTDLETIEHREITVTDSRNERKRKRPNRNKTKSKPTTQKPSTTTNKRLSDPKQYDGLYSGFGSYLTPVYVPNQDIFEKKRPPTDMTYLINTVRKQTTTTTPKPDYQFHIQINYFYNTTTERNLRPTKPTVKRPVYNYDQNFYNQHNYMTGPDFYGTTDRIDYGPVRYPTTDRIDYGPVRYPTTDRIDYVPIRYPTIDQTKKPPTSSNPITIIEINSQNAQRPEMNKPNIYFINDDSQPQKPTYDFNYRPNPYRPGHITKLDSKPLLVYDHADFPPEDYHDHKQYGTEVIYDHEYLANKRRPYYQPTYSTISDKLDFDKHTPKPYENDKHFIKISTVKGHQTHTDSLNPVYINVQNKESADDLQMTYDDILEVYVKTDDEKAPTAREDSDETTTLTKTDSQLPDDELYDTELPKPMDLFLDI